MIIIDQRKLIRFIRATVYSIQRMVDSCQKNISI